MTSGLVINVEHAEDSRTEVFTGDSVSVRPDADADVSLPATFQVDLDIRRQGDHYAVTDFTSDTPLLLNDAPLVAGSPLLDGDVVRLADDRLRLRFFPVGVANAIVARHTGELRSTGELMPDAFGLQRDTGALIAPHGVHVAPFIEHATIEAAATARRDDAKVFLREFTRELVREISPAAKILSFLVVSALVAGVIYFPYAYYKELQRNRRENEALRAQIVAVTQQLGATRGDLMQLDDKNSSIVRILTNAPNLVAKYSGGVCLIVGTYQWYEQGTNRPLRNRQTGADSNSVDEDAADSAANASDPGDGATLTPDGAGAIAQFDFVGTGFHVGGGYILTNRHVAARPWEADPRSQYLTGTVPARARITRLVAFFPNRKQPLVLRLRASDAAEDLAVCTADAVQAGDVPVLPLDEDTRSVEIGNDVVMIGFPSGPDRLLSLLDESEARIAQARYGSSIESLIGFLAARNLVRPLTTRGTITDLLARRLIYDARTAEGGSGAPLFGQSGRVIGVNFAVLTSNSASNLAVPVSFARELLTRTGWRSTEENAAKIDAAASPDPSAANPPKADAQRGANANAAASTR